MLSSTLKPKPSHSLAELREVFAYDPSTGLITWAKTLPRTATKGAPAGAAHTEGYRTVGYDGRNYMCHRLAWLLVNGVWPAGVIDHINGDRADNRIENLRDVDVACNSQNLKTAHKDSHTGFLGVRRNGPHLFAARICVRGMRVWLGNHKTAEEAHAAYLKAKRVLHEGGTL